MNDYGPQTLLEQTPAYPTRLFQFADDVLEPFGAPELLFAAFLALLALLILAEKHRPARQPDRSIVRRSYTVNLGAFLFNDLFLSLCQAPMLYLIAARHSSHGLLSDSPQGPTKLVAALLLLDLTLFAWHWLCHHCDALWVFHKVHHSDLSVNVTTGLRYHLGELFLEVVVRSLFCVVAGVDFETLLLCQGLMSLFVLFHHGNLRLPGEAWLSYLLVTPRLHRVHHSALRGEHDSNYGAILSVWDRLFGVLRTGEPRAIGLQGVAEQGFFDLLKYGCTRKIAFKPEESMDKMGSPLRVLAQRKASSR